MGALHRRLRESQAPADALVRARADVHGGTPDPLSSFVCLGAGWSPSTRPEPAVARLPEGTARA
jgi:hypothetical protein